MNLFYMHFTNTHFQNVPILHLTRAGNPINVLLTSRNPPEYFYQCLITIFKCEKGWIFDKTPFCHLKFTVKRKIPKFFMKKFVKKLQSFFCHFKFCHNRENRFCSLPRLSRKNSVAIAHVRHISLSTL